MHPEAIACRLGSKVSRSRPFPYDIRTRLSLSRRAAIAFEHAHACRTTAGHVDDEGIGTIKGLLPRIRSAMVAR